jgi:hypothetical protein
MGLELARFASLLLAILALNAVLHTAFLAPGRTLAQQLLPALRMLLLAAGVSVASGLLFCWEETRATRRARPLARSLPMMVFWWGSGLLSLLFAASWFVERYVLHAWS